jgi:hypothetical protein
MMLALAGCGPNEYQDSNAMTYTTSSGMVDDGGETPSVDQNYAGQVGTILFVASPGDGKPQQLISRTNSITSAPTAEFLAREAIAARQRAPTDSNKLTPPLVIAAEDDVDGPILLPTASGTTPGITTPGSTAPGSTTPGSTTPGSTTPGSTTPGSTTPGSTTPQTGAPQAGADAPSTANPTILKIIQAP